MNLKCFCTNEATRFYKLQYRRSVRGSYVSRPAGEIKIFCEEHWKVIFTYSPWEETSKNIIIAEDIIER